jgi:hypothetical protein
VREKQERRGVKGGGQRKPGKRVCVRGLIASPSDTGRGGCLLVAHFCRKGFRVSDRRRGPRPALTHPGLRGSTCDAKFGLSAPAAFWKCTSRMLLLVIAPPAAAKRSFPSRVKHSQPGGQPKTPLATLLLLAGGRLYWRHGVSSLACLCVGSVVVGGVCVE